MELRRNGKLIRDDLSSGPEGERDSSLHLITHMEEDDVEKRSLSRKIGAERTLEISETSVHECWVTVLGQYCLWPRLGKKGREREERRRGT